MARSDALETDTDPVVAWRFDELVRAGYYPEQAWVLACSPDVDVHLAERLLAAGCAPETAERILL